MERNGWEMKKVMNYFLVICFVVNVFFPLTARAASDEVNPYGDSPSVAITRKVTDDDGNRYSITGRTTRTGKRVQYIQHLM